MVESLTMNFTILVKGFMDVIFIKHLYVRGGNFAILIKF